jgi:hypothetical protein
VCKLALGKRIAGMKAHPVCGYRLVINVAIAPFLAGDVVPAGLLPGKPIS